LKAILKKIAIIINWPREYDMYEKLIKNLPYENFQILINDVKGFDRERLGNAKDIEELLINKGIKKYSFLKKNIGHQKFKIVLSTGEVCTHRLTVYSFLKWIYAQTFGRFLDFTNLSLILKKYFKRPFNADGKFSIPFSRWYPEKIISEISIKYPQGMDLNYIYPDKKWQKYFDIFLTHGSADTKMITKKFPTKKVFIIGYPRYADYVSERVDQIDLSEFNNNDLFDKNKETILWLPSHIKEESSYGQNILKWLKSLQISIDRYNVIIRPHPKTIKIFPELKKVLTDQKLIIDLKQDRKIGKLINFSKLILCDYGGPIFSSIYLEKNILLLNYLNNTKFVKDKINSFSFDIEARKFLTSCDMNIDSENLYKIIKKEITSDKLEKIKEIKNFYFGPKNKINNINDTSDFLIKMLKN